MRSKPSKIVYDKESGVLSIEMARTKSVDSEVHGNTVIDYDKKGNAVRVLLYGFNFDAFREGTHALKTYARQTRVPVLVR